MDLCSVIHQEVADSELDQNTGRLGVDVDGTATLRFRTRQGRVEEVQFQIPQGSQGATAELAAKERELEELRREVEELRSVVNAEPSTDPEDPPAG